MLILNSGGTFNKRYNPISGEIEVPVDNEAIDKILSTSGNTHSLAGVIYKDSLDIDLNDRKTLASIIMESTEDTFVIVHGTDTMDITSEFLNEIFEDRKIILVGAMTPFAIEPIEATLNLGIALGYAEALELCGVYICMNGFVKPWNKIYKNKEQGRFELV